MDSRVVYALFELFTSELTLSQTIAGSAAGVPGLSGIGGVATSSLLSRPSGVAFDQQGNLAVADAVSETRTDRATRARLQCIWVQCLLLRYLSTRTD